MQRVDRYQIAANTDGERSRLVRADAPETSIDVDGRVLEAQFALGHDATLVWLTDDSPYEEGLHIYLLSAAGRIEDAVEAGAAWTAGILEILATSERSVDFTFFRNDSRYRLDVEDSAEIRLLLPAGWRYKTHLQRHRLDVHLLPGGPEQ